MKNENGETKDYEKTTIRIPRYLIAEARREAERIRASVNTIIILSLEERYPKAVAIHKKNKASKGEEDANN